MPNDYYAIVVGINDYPGLKDKLDGAVRDAQIFYEWVTEENGGGVPKTAANACLITSRKDLDQFLDLEKKVHQARPNHLDIKKKLKKYWDHSLKKKTENGVQKLGKRLYIYLSGHGFEAMHGGFTNYGYNVETYSPALLTANATPRKEGNPYVVPPEYALAFYCRGVFEETILIMDCCRDQREKVRPSFPDIYTKDIIEKEESIRWLAFACQCDKKSKEKKMPDGQIHGVFSYVLMEGLKGGLEDAASDPTGSITSDLLGYYLENRMGDFFDQHEHQSLHISTIPSIKLFPEKKRSFIISKISRKLTKVIIDTGQQNVNKNLSISKVNKYRKLSTIQRKLTEPNHTIDLIQGHYIFQLEESGLDTCKLVSIQEQEVYIKL